MYERLIENESDNQSGPEATELFVSESLSEFAGAVKDAKKDPAAGWGFARGRGEWVGRDFQSVSEACDASTQSWPDGVRTIRKMRDQIQESTIAPPKTRKRRQAWSEETGDELDLDRLRSGQPWWRTTKRRRATGLKRMTVLADLTAGSRVSAEDVMWRGAAAVIICEILEEAGYRGSLWVGRYSTGVWEDGTGQCMLIRLKHFGDRLNIATLASAVSSWFLRAVIFGACNLRHDHGGSKRQLGSPDNISIHERIVESDPESLITVKEVWTEQDAVSLIERVLERIEKDG